MSAAQCVSLWKCSEGSVTETGKVRSTDIACRPHSCKEAAIRQAKCARVRVLIFTVACKTVGRGAK